MTSRRIIAMTLGCATSLAFVAARPSVCGAQWPASQPAATAKRDGRVDRPTPEQSAAIERGLKWLAEQQKPDGSFGSGSQYGRHVGITSLACLAFMSEGSMPERGRYSKNVDLGLEFVLKACSDQSGLIAAETSYGPMYGHGFATLFLAEAYGMSHRGDLREKLQKAVALIVRTQNDQGGWRYHPVKADADISVTICQVMALRAARNAGITVPKEVIDKSIKYVRESQNPDGGFRYMLDSAGSMFARSAAGVAALYYAGMYDDPVIRKGLGYLKKFTPGKTEEQTHYYYGHYYAVQAMHVAGGEHWEQWWPAIRDELLVKQLPDGSWRGEAGTEYGTAMALIVLQVPRGNLPILQR
ncbi:Prenyltransferase and squalene oxidase repeat protein [Phycisphaerae bacterium RAS2]|nr:Prenyltransferase and squalene oxidase repeat protein [Phycisphaerae bacterium RAS2]